MVKQGQYHTAPKRVALVYTPFIHHYGKPSAAQLHNWKPPRFITYKQLLHAKMITFIYLRELSLIFKFSTLRLRVRQITELDIYACKDKFDCRVNR